MKNEKLALLGGAPAFTLKQELSNATRWPVFGDEEKQAVLELLEGGKGTYAPIDEFESAFAEYHGTKYVLAHNNGTSAIHSAYFAVGVGPGDEVIVPAYTWQLQVAQILTLHGVPVFCDVDPQDATIDPNEIERKITPRTKVIAILHPYGAVAPMDDIMEIARKHGLPVIEDCSHAHGATYKGKKVGTIGDIGCFSLQASKLMTAVEGGALITNNEEYYERGCVLGHYERIPKLNSEKYSRFHRPGKLQAPSCFGFKYRIHPIAAALALVQLKHLDEWNAVRRHNMGYLSEALSKISEAFEPAYERPHTERLWLSYLCSFHSERAGGVSGEKFAEALKAEGLPATGNAGYFPAYWNPIYEERVSMWGEGYPFDSPAVKDRVEYRRGDCPQAEELYKRTIGLPVLHHPCDQSLLDAIVETIAKVLRNIDQLRK